jgi:ribose-phosphate pyrophosphokinase
MIIIPGPSSVNLGKKIASELGVQMAPVEYRVFPDGESYIKLTSSVEEKNVAIVQTTATDPDSKLMQLYLIASAARDFNSKRIVAVVPYLAYSRQDKRFLDMEALSIDVVFRLLKASGVTDLIVVDVHKESSLKDMESKHSINIHNLSAIPSLASYMKTIGFEGAYSLSPDKGAINLAETASRILGGGYNYFEKRRDRKTGAIEMEAKNLDISGKKAVVFDDIVSSGGTMVKAVEALVSQGAKQVAAACTHALFMDGAADKIRRAGADPIIVSDTIETSYSKVSVAGVIANKLREML